MELSGFEFTIESVVSILFIIVAIGAFLLTISFYIGHKRSSKKKTTEQTVTQDSNEGKYFKKTKL